MRRYLFIHYYTKACELYENKESLTNRLKDFFDTTAGIEEAQESNSFVILDMKTQKRIFIEADLTIELVNEHSVDRRMEK